MFDPSNETEAGWDLDIRDDVIEECKTHGGIFLKFLHTNSKEYYQSYCPRNSRRSSGKKCASTREEKEKVFIIFTNQFKS
jgi:hypothetical protein